MTKTRSPDRLSGVAACLAGLAALLSIGGCGGNARDRSAPVIGLTDLVARDRETAPPSPPVATRPQDAAPSAPGEAVDPEDLGVADRGPTATPALGAITEDGLAEPRGADDGGESPVGGALAGQPERSNSRRSGDGPRGAPARTDWIVDGLVGQINGRPVFAESFLEVLEDRILQIVRTRPRAAARDEIIMLVNARFDDWVNSELIIAEAESMLSPEQQMGVIAWLRDVQEGEILRRGGTRAAAESSLQDETGMGIEEFMELRRNRALAMDLLRRRVTPRVIVTSRDIEREYQRRFDEFNPGATLRVGRIWLETERDADRIALAERRFASGSGFREVADELDLPDSGLWREFQLGPEGIAGIDLAEELRNRLEGLAVNRPSERFVQGRRTVWLGIVDRDQPPARGLFDPEVQMQLRNELQARREAVERERYLASLRQRWIAEDIDEMRFRLIDIALRRYWR